MKRLKQYVKPGFTDCLEMQAQDNILSGSVPGAAGGGDFPGVQKSRLYRDYDDEFFDDDDAEE